MAFTKALDDLENHYHMILKVHISKWTFELCVKFWFPKVRAFFYKRPVICQNGD